MVVHEVERLVETFVVEELGGLRVFDSRESTFKEYLEIKYREVVSIEPASDGGCFFIRITLNKPFSIG